MNQNIQTAFKAMNAAFDEKRLDDVYQNLIKFYEKWTCNCFLREQAHDIFENQLEIIEEIADDDLDYQLNLIKGYVYLRNKNEQQGYKYLTTAIRIDDTIDLPFSLRASIEPEINSEHESDAKNAVLLNPTARNYFVLANSYDYKQEDKKELKKSLIYFNKAIEIREDFTCAYNNRGLRYKELQDYEKACEDFIKCVQLEETHWAYYQIWYCSDELNKYDQALEYAKLGLVHHSDNLNYQFALGVANSRVGNYKTAIEHYKNYLKVYPNSQVVRSNMEISQRKLSTSYLTDAKTRFNNDDYENSIDLFEKYLAYNDDLWGEDLDMYLVGLLKISNPNIKFNEENKIYKKLDELKLSYNEKLENGEDATEEEDNANKLMEYQGRYKIGFGKHEGKTINDIIEEDPHYILWCVINLEHFSIEKSLLNNSRLKMEPNFLAALENNLIKELIIEKWKPEEEDYEYYDDYHDDPYADYGRSTEKYGGYNGYSDDVIDDAFEGDPSLTWNID